MEQQIKSLKEFQESYERKRNKFLNDLVHKTEDFLKLVEETTYHTPAIFLNSDVIASPTKSNETGLPPIEIVSTPERMLPILLKEAKQIKEVEKSDTKKDKILNIGYAIQHRVNQKNPFITFLACMVEERFVATMNEYNMPRCVFIIDPILPEEPITTANVKTTTDDMVAEIASNIPFDKAFIYLPYFIGKNTTTHELLVVVKLFRLFSKPPMLEFDIHYVTKLGKTTGEVLDNMNFQITNLVTGFLDSCGIKKIQLKSSTYELSELLTSNEELAKAIVGDQFVTKFFSYNKSPIPTDEKSQVDGIQAAFDNGFREQDVFELHLADIIESESLNHYAASRPQALDARTQNFPFDYITINEVDLGAVYSFHEVETTAENAENFEKRASFLFFQILLGTWLNYYPINYIQSQLAPISDTPLNTNDFTNLLITTKNTINELMKDTFLLEQPFQQNTNIFGSYLNIVNKKIGLPYYQTSLQDKETMGISKSLAIQTEFSSSDDDEGIIKPFPHLTTERQKENSDLWTSDSEESAIFDSSDD